jgi:hypothetical protein
MSGTSTPFWFLPDQGQYLVPERVFANGNPDVQSIRVLSNLTLPDAGNADQRRHLTARMNPDMTAATGRQFEDLFAPALDRGDAGIRPPASANATRPSWR